jgi:hypothetical protein
MLHKLAKVNFKLNPSKCCFGSKNKFTFLRHVVDCNKSQPNPKKIATVVKFPQLKTININTFLGLIGYYGRFIVEYAKITKRLFALIKKEFKFVWTPICQATFVTLKRKLVETPIVVRLHFSKTFILDVD